MEKTVHLLIMYTMLVLTLLLFHKGRKHQRSLLLALYALVEVITNGLNSLTLSGGWEFFDKYPFSHFIYKPLYCLWVPLFYFYVRSCFSIHFQWKKNYWIHFIPFALYLFYFLGIWIAQGNHYIWENLYNEGSLVHTSVLTIDFVVKFQYLAYNFLLIRKLLTTEKELKRHTLHFATLPIEIKWLRFIVYGYALGCAGGIIVLVTVLFFPHLTSTVNSISISYFFIFFFVIFYDTITHKSFENGPKQVQRLNPDSAMESLMRKVDNLVKEKQLYLEPDLSLNQIALALNEKERTISQAINTLQKRNVKDYFNSFRIEHACGLLNTEKDKPIFEIMFESGFNTKGAFNLAFKKITGKTPSEYRNQSV